MKFYHLYQDTASEWRWRYQDDQNWKTIADSGEGYKNKADCIAGIDFMRQSSNSPIYQKKLNPETKKEEWVKEK